MAVDFAENGGSRALPEKAFGGAARQVHIRNDIGGCESEARFPADPFQRAIDDWASVLTASGALSISGLFEIVPDDSGVKIAKGTRWMIGSVVGFDLPERLRFSAGNGFRVFAEGNAENGWTLYAEKGSAGLLFILR